MAPDALQALAAEQSDGTIAEHVSHSTTCYTSCTYCTTTATTTDCTTTCTTCTTSTSIPPPLTMTGIVWSHRRHNISWEERVQRG